MKRWFESMKFATRAALGVALAVVALSASAQDYPTLQGTNQRQGKNAGTLASPGRALLNWYAPVITNAGDLAQIVRDNGSSVATATGVWNAPNPDDAAGNYFRAFTTTNPLEDAVVGYDDPFVSPPDLPAYLYAFTVPAGQGSDPTIKNFLADQLRSFEWVIEPFSLAQRAARNYALYVWLPSGPTGDGVGGLIFPQRYFVYEIIYGGSRRWIDVVDTYRAGTGWVRLGNGGLPTNRLFDYDGATPIRIRLYNTVPRRNGHENDVVNSPLANWLGVFTDIPYTSAVYADAAMAVPVTGDIAGTPIVSQIDPINALLGTHVVYARNNYSVGIVGGVTSTNITGQIRSANFSNGTTRWTYTPLAESQYTATQDNNSAGVTVQAPFAASTAEPGYQGTNYHLAPIVNVLGTEAVMRYAPTLNDGAYDIYVFLPGSRGAESLGTQVEYRILEGANPPIVLTLNQDAGGGWVRLGNRRYSHRALIGEPLRVEVSNYSANVADLGRSSYADAVRFVGAANLGITSTPVHTNARVRVTNGGPIVSANVVLIATEDGRIHCVSAEGNPDGTTNVYWTYPSTPDPANPSWTDPNAVAAEDGGIATMPTGFDLSSALVQTIGGEDYLYIATKNGRVYCIEMAGRGDMDLVNRKPGTTRRVWSFPDDYPAPTPHRSFLGTLTGSIAYAEPPAGPTIYVPAAQGRMYALDALPTLPNTTKTTTIRWTYPALNQPTVGPMRATPIVAGNTVFVGTEQKVGDDRGRLFALDWNTGAVQWEFNGTTAWDVAGGGTTFIPADDFNSGPAFATAAEVGGAMPDTLFIANDNRWITALNATNGTVLWTTDELQSSVIGNLTFTTINAFTGGGGGARAIAPVVMVPTADGRFVALFARAGVGFPAQNRFGTKRAWEYVSASGPLFATLSVGRGYMYGADSAGFVYAFNDVGDGSDGNINGPGGGTAVENDDSNVEIENFRNAKIKFVTKDTFQRLRLPANDPNHLSYAQALAAANEVTRTQFDWGEYLYVLVYDLPYDVTTPPPPSVTVAPPVVNYAFSVDGAAFRNLSIESRQFRLPATAPLAIDGVTRLDGYAVLAFPIQGGGSNALPPGAASVTFSITTQAAANPVRQTNIGLNPATSRKDFGISNPIGLFMVAADPTRSIGTVVDPSDDGRRVNGSPDIASTGGIREDRLTASTGVTSHTRTGTTQVGVVDTSLMTLLRGPGRGLDNVRVDRNDLNWRGGRAAVINRLIDIPFYAAFYAGGKGLEDYPDNSPNTSLDYPDMERERIRVTKELFGMAENPVFGPVSLTPPDNVVENAVPFPTRTLVPTPFDLAIDVPQFQPPNLSTVLDSAGTNVPAGYMGRMSVFVDTDGSGTLTRGGGRREAFRSFWLGTSVAEDASFQIETPTIDFGSLATGTGYSPLAPGAPGSNYTPFPTPTVALGTNYDRGAFPYTDIFKPVVIRNTGNRNLLNLRISKFYDQGAGIRPWEIFSANDNELMWLNGGLDLHATFDERFALTPVPILQKARVGDASGTTFSDIPFVRDNPNINATAGFLFTPGVGGFPDVAREVLAKGPRIGLSVPLGFPSTRLSQIVRIFEDVNGDESLALDANGNAIENMADPTVTLKASVREARLTNSFTSKTAPMVESLASEAAGNEAFTHVNQQPAVMRNRNGHLALLFASDRFGHGVGTGFDKSQPTAAEDNQEARIYAVSLEGVNPNLIGSPSPLGDLNAFAPANAVAWPNGRWWRHDVAEFPSTPLATLFPGDPVVPGTARFHSPSLPTRGDVNPFNGGALAQTYMSFVGTVQKQGTTERYPDTRIFVAPISIGANGAISLGAEVGLPNDPLMAKGKAAIVQGNRGATVFFTAAGTGQSSIHYAHFDGATWGATQVLQTGSGFETVGGPSVSGRVYEGVAGPGTPSTGQNILEISFTGKLRGRPAADIFFGRMTANVNAVPSGLVFFPLIQNERLVAEREVGVYRAAGVTWNRRNTLQVSQSLDGGLTLTDIEVPNTRVTDQSTGIVSFDTILGGKAYLDPNLGTVRLANTLPSRNSQLYLTYQPRFLRVSAGGAAYSGSNLHFDNRLISDIGYWASSPSTPITNADVVRPARFVFTYNKAASGNVVARPYMQTVRLGVQLPTSVATRQDGSIVGITVTGAGSYWQVDPANGRVYFTAADENRVVSVAYTGVDDAGNPVAIGAQNYAVGMLTEKAEAPIPIEQAANETQLATYLDPFEGTLANRRPGLFWLFWTSTRVGSPDVYFQTLAPKFTPQPRN